MTKDNWEIVDSAEDSRGQPVDIWRQGRSGSFLVIASGVDISNRDLVVSALGSTKESALKNYNTRRR